MAEGTENGQSYDCPSIAATQSAKPPNQRTPERAVLRLPLHCSRRWCRGMMWGSRRTGSLTTAPPLQLGSMRLSRCRRPANGQSYDCPSIAAPGRVPVAEAREGTGSLTTAPPLQPTPPPSCPHRWDKERAVLRLPLHCSHSASCSSVSKRGERAVLRLPLHCSCRVCCRSREVVGQNGQSYDCPSIAAASLFHLHPPVPSRTGSLTTAPPLQRGRRFGG